MQHGIRGVEAIFFLYFANKFVSSVKNYAISNTIFQGTLIFNDIGSEVLLPKLFLPELSLHLLLSLFSFKCFVHLRVMLKDLQFCFSIHSEMLNILQIIHPLKGNVLFLGLLLEQQFRGCTILVLKIGHLEFL